MAQLETEVTLAKPLRLRPADLLGRDWDLGYLLLAPVLAVLLGLVAYPFVLAIFLRVTDKTIGGQAHFVGLQNYFFLVASPEFRQSTLITLFSSRSTLGCPFFP